MRVRMRRQEEEEEVNTPTTRMSAHHSTIDLFHKTQSQPQKRRRHTFLTPPRAFRREDPEPLLRALEDCCLVATGQLTSSGRKVRESEVGRG